MVVRDCSPHARRKRCVHLTNYSLNKKSAKFTQNETTDDEASGACCAHVQATHAGWHGCERASMHS